MTNEQRTLRQLINEGMYVVDEPMIAGAIIARAHVNATVARNEFHSRFRPTAIRSFRRDPSARSFRLERAQGGQR